MSNSEEIIKNAILSEIEEGQNHVNPKPPKIQEEVLSVCADRDFKLSPDALQKAISNGIDPRFLRTQWFSKKSVVSSTPKRSKSVDEGVFEDQFDTFLCRLEIFEEEWASGEDDGDMSARDRILAIKLSKAAFEPLLQPLKNSRPILHHALSQHGLVSGRQKTKRRQSKRSRKKEKRERDREEREAKETYDEIRNRAGVVFSGVANDMLPDWEQYRQILAMVVAKGVAEGSFQSLLIVTSLLLQIYRNHNQESSNYTGLQMRDKYDDLSIPIGSILGAMFERSEAEDAPSNTDNETMHLSIALTKSPFHYCLQNFLRDDLGGNKGMSFIDFFCGEVGSQGTMDEGLNTEETTSQHGTLVSEEAGSTVGSSTMAEQGTETASMGGEGEMEEDLTEEELLAQAMALSLGPSAGGAASSDVASVGSPQRRSDGAPAIGSANTLSLSQSTLSRVDFPRISAGKGLGTGGGSVTSSGGDARSQPALPLPEIPEKLPHVPVMSTFGPFCDVRFWQTLHSTEGFAAQNPSNVPLVHVIIALLTWMSASCDEATGESTGIAQGSSLCSGGGFVIAGEECFDPNANSKKESRSRTKCLLPLNGSAPIIPHTVTFLLLELLLEMFTAEIKCMSESAFNQDRGRDRPRERDGDAESMKRTDSDEYWAPNSPPSSNTPVTSIDGKKWTFDRYFLVWSMVSVLKILRAHLNSLEVSRISPGSLGLGLSVGDGHSDSSQSLSFAMKLLQRISECMGAETAPIRCDSSLDVGLMGLGVQKLRLTSGFGSLSPMHSDKSYRHSLRIAGIDTYVAGICVFHPTVQQRQREIVRLLSRAPLPASSENQYGGNLLAPFLGEANLSMTSHKPKDDQSFADVIFPRSAETYRLYLLQRFCMAVADGDLVSPSQNQVTAGGLNIGLSASASTSSSGSDPIPSVENTSSSAQNLPRIPSFLEFRDQRLGIEALNQNLGYPSEDDGASSVSGLGTEGTLQWIETTLLSRIGHEEIMLYFPTYARTQNYEAFVSNSCIFWGELSLLRYLQLRHVHSLTGGQLDPFTATWEFLFNPRKCNQNISILNNGQTIVQKNVKSWGTVLSTKGFEPDSGIHQWTIRLDNCDKGDIFIGVCAADANVDTYVGGDKYGWGMIGTRSLWHSQSKVRSEYGQNFNTLGSVTVTLDTNSGQLSYAGDGVGWGVAFENIPKDQALYPAVSLYHRDEQVTAFTQTGFDVKKKKKSGLDSRILDSELSMKSDALSGYIPFVRYSKSLFSMINNILKSAEAMDDDRKRQAALSHPFIGLLLPSLAASLVAGRLSLHTTSLLSLQLLPQLMILAKRLSSLHERFGKILNDASLQSDHGFIRNIGGIWLIRSSAAGNNIPAQEYHFEIQVSNEGSMESKKEDQISEDLLPVIISARGVGPLSGPGVHVSGTVFGTRIKFRELWSGGTNSTVEGRLSLDGNYFNGLFKDAKTSTTGSLEGIKVSYRHRIRAANTLLKAGLLCSMAYGKLAAMMVVGIETMQTGPIFIPASIGTSNTSKMNTLAEGSDKSDDNLQSDERDWRDEESTIENNPNILDESKSDPGAQEDSNTTENALAVSETVKTWLQSSILSGGLPLDVRVLSDMRGEIEGYMSNEMNSFSTDSEANTYHIGLQQWWASKMFPQLFPSIEERENSTDYASSRGEQGRLPPFLVDMLDGRNAAKHLDEYITHHLGTSVTSKLGGEPLQTARKSVLAAIIWHSGCLPLCEYEQSQIKAKVKEESERPHEWLVLVWRAAQRVVEHAIWQKQQSGATYSSLAHGLCKKAEFLLSIMPSEGASLTSVLVQTNIKDGPQKLTALTSTDVQLDFSKLIAESVEFLQTTMKVLDVLRVEMIRTSTRTLSRIAGFRAFRLLFSKADGGPENVSRLSPLASILQSAAIEYILPALIGHIDIRDRISSPKTVPGDSLLLVSASTSSINQAANDHSHGGGHYMDGLRAASSTLVVELRQAVEAVYVLVTQLLQRATWGGDRDCQCAALSPWGMNVQPDDHRFLNQVGIFRVLQAVMESVRTSITSAPAPGEENVSREGDEAAEPSSGSVFAMEFVSNSDKRVAHLVLRIVHALASQVAFSKLPEKVATQSIRMNRMLSGPETLSQALFDMLYSELHYGLKKSIMSVFNGKLPKKPLVTGAEGPLDEFLDGDQYVYRILRLLVSVSNATVCQNYLLSPKWITLLLVAVGCGSLVIQRRLFRLLRRLLASAFPESCRAFVCSLFADRRAVVESDGSLTDDEARSLCDEQNATDTNTGAHDLSLQVTVAERIIRLLLEGVSVFVPPTEFSTDAEVRLLKHLHVEGMETTLSAESISILRQLHEVSGWRSYLWAEVSRFLAKLSSGEEVDWNNHSLLRMVAAGMSVLGGYVDRVRPGGLVLLRPFSLAGLSESFALKLAAASHSCALVLSRISATHSVEVVLTDRGRKSKTTSSLGPNNPNPNTTPSPSGQFTSLNSSGSSSNVISSSYIAPVNVSMAPAKSVKMSEDDVLPTWDIAIAADLVPASVMSLLLNLLDSRGLPWVLSQINMGGCSDEVASRNEIETALPATQNVRMVPANDEDSKDTDAETEHKDNDESLSAESKEDPKGVVVDGESLTDLELLQFYVITANFRSIANLMQSDSLVGVIGDSPQRLRDMLYISVSETQSGGLGVIEQIEQRWAVLWDELTALKYKDLFKESTGGSSQSNTDSAAGRVNEAEPSRVGPSSSSGLAARLEAAAASNILASLGAPIGIDPNTARKHMMEMGFPKEWCEVALRRCRYNVEMAINLCFEHGTDMDQLVSEDAAIMSAQAARNPRRFQGSEFDSPTSRVDNESATTSSASTIPGTRIFLGARSGGRQPTVDRSLLMKQLLEMGFPPSWCAKALDVNQNNVDAALTWILSHGDELVSDEDGEGDGGDEDCTGGDDEKEAEEMHLVPNPLSVVSGVANISQDYTCSMPNSSRFPSIGCRLFGVDKGKWYYEMRLITAGCIQVGWADAAFEGNAESGQGVGDDAHSWAYDGWRVYIWHEIYADWGCKWAPGDIVGCALDMDSKRMSFFLNGFGREVGMGEAFNDFSHCGPLYPAVSFNHNEQVQFNFGATPFKFEPPEGYLAYSTHIQDVLADCSVRLNEATLDNWAGSPPNTRVSEDEENDNDSSSQWAIENSVEEQRGEADFLWQRRYFASDEGRLSQQSSPRLPVAKLSGSIPPVRGEIVLQFKQISRDLCILYTRLAVLRVVAAYPRVSDECESVVLNQILGKDDWYRDNQEGPRGEMLLLLIRLCGAPSSRTRVYLQTMSILSSSQPVPANIGSLLSVGGAPMLHALQSAMSAIVKHAREKSDVTFVESMLHLVKIDTVRATKREYVSEWRLENCFCPALYRDGPLLDSNCVHLPSLQLSLWITIILLDQIAVEVSSGLEADVKDRALTTGWLKILVKTWCTALRSPSMSVKLCAMRMLSIIVQELSTPGAKLTHLSDDDIDAVLNEIPRQRLENMVHWRLMHERSSVPICSDYLQTMMELTIALRSARGIKRDVPELSESFSHGTLPLNGRSVDTTAVEGNWEAVDGLLLSDDGWDTWTGKVSQQSSGWITKHTSVQLSEKPQDQPPELMPGCKVVKPKPKRIVDPSEDDSSGEPSSSSSFINETPPSPPESLEIPSKTSPRNFRVSRSSRDVQGDQEFVIGTVTAITNWPGCAPGTARKVKWEQDESTPADANEEELVRWGAYGDYDVIHVECNKQGKITTKYSKPLSAEVKLSRVGFGTARSFGVIVRLRDAPRRETDEGDIAKRVDGIMEWPDFSAIVYVRGVKWSDGTLNLTEDRLVTGPQHADWSVRFGCAEWKRGTTYELSSPRSLVDAKSGVSAQLLGHFSYKVTTGQQQVLVAGDIQLQKSRLFVFDETCCGRPIVLSGDKLAVSCPSDRLDGRPCVFGNIGFTSGVHYWEFKIDQADLGSVYVGVAEKPPPSSFDGFTDRLKRWHGCGAVNNRLSFRGLSGSSTGKEQYYGDNFHTGDTVGVLLDMNRGRLSFFLDGMKYGEHTLADLGEAFDNLVGSAVHIRPKALFPVIGFRKVVERSADRVVLTSRWVSCVGQLPSQTFSLVSCAWNLLTYWGCDRNLTRKAEAEEWIYREGWRDWLKWRLGRYMRVRSRCKTHSLLLNLDTSPRACVEASINLGLPLALFCGDHVFFTKSCGKHLESKEEAVILGAYGGLLWYRLDSQQDDGSLQEGSSIAWCLASHDVESMVVSRRAGGENSLPPTLVNLELPRIPTYHGGRLRVVYEGGAVIRDGLEIDTSDVIGTVDLNSEVYSIERRINSSNIPRYRVLFQGKFGWISENIRGGTEEPMVTRITQHDATALADARAEVLAAVSSSGLPYRVLWEDVSSKEAAMQRWEDKVVNELHMKFLLDSTERLSSEDDYDRFCDLSWTTDGEKPWSVEADMQLSELISRTAAREGVTPQNLSHKHIVSAVAIIGSFDNSATSLLSHTPIERIIARCAVLRVANRLFDYTLPYLSMVLPEEKWRCDRLGGPDEVEVVSSSLPAPPEHLTAPDEHDVPSFSPVIQAGRVMEENWHPPCCARRIRSLRRLLFTQTKRQFWESILDATTTPTALQQDEYEDPKDIKVIRINRVRATQSRLASITNPTDRVRQSVFGQLHKEMRTWSSSAFRRSYLGKGHGGQKRAFKVKFTGEGVNDYGGPYRAVFEQVVDELQADCSTSSTAGRPWEKCLLPLLFPCPNRVSGVGANQDKFVFNPAPPSPMTQELMQYFGKLVGTAVRHNLNLALDLSALVWRPLVKLATSRAHLETIDSLTLNSFKKIEELGLELEKEWAGGCTRNGVTVDRSYVPESWEDLNFTIALSDSSVRMPLCLNGEDIPVTVGNWREFLQLAERARLKECVSMYKVFRDGLATVLPIELTPLFSALELEHLVSGSRKVNLKLLRQCTEYENLDPDSDFVRNFWEVIEEMSDEERTLFLRFVWARSRMPSSAQDLPMNFKLQGASNGAANEKPDQYLPHAQTCFFSLSLPPYSSKEILRSKLLYAINNSPNMDADVRLHSAEGWADS